jgi:hypothetical protein
MPAGCLIPLGILLALGGIGGYSLAMFRVRELPTARHVTVISIGPPLK